MLNKDVYMYFTSQIREPVIAAITLDGKFTAFESKTGIPPLNQISISNVIKELQSDLEEKKNEALMYNYRVIFNIKHPVKKKLPPF
jgi:hypothetical protein